MWLVVWPRMWLVLWPRMWLVLCPGCGVIVKASYCISMAAYGTGACFASARIGTTACFASVTVWERIGTGLTVDYMGSGIAYGNSI